MNGSNPIFPLIGIGQAASVQTGQASEGGSTEFAENLTSALAALSLTTVMPTLQRSETPIASLQGGLIAGTPEAALSATDKSELNGGVQKTGIFRPTGNADISVSAGSAGSATVTDSGPQANGRGTIDTVKVTERPNALADIERVPLGVEGASLKPSMVAKTDPSDLPETRHPELASVNTATMRSSGDLGLDRHVADDGGRPGPASSIKFQDRHPQIVPGGVEMAAMDEAPQLVGRPLREIAPEVNASVKTMPPSEVPLSDMPLAEGMRSTRPTSPASVIAGEDQARTMPSPSSLSDLQAAAPRMSMMSQRTELLQPVIEGQAAAGVGTSLQPEASSLVAGRGESVLPVQRPSPGARNDRTSHQVIRPHASEAGPHDLSEDRPLAARQGIHPVTVNEALGKSGMGAFPNAATQSTVLDGSLRLTNEIGGFDRLQPALSGEGALHDPMRFEAASNLGQLKAQAPLAHAPASTQVALQIVRSMPEGVDRFSVHLQPAELGRVDIQLDFEAGGRLSALITAERPETLELLQRDSRLLERSLGDSGLKLASDGLSFALKQDQQQQQQGQGFQEQAQAHQAAVRAGRAYDDTLDTEQVPSATRVDGLRLLDIET